MSENGTLSNSSSVRSICVYLGSNEGNDPEIAEMVKEFGLQFKPNGLRLICGGGGKGLMKLLVDTVFGSGAEVVGITPEFLTKREGRSANVTTQIVTKDMHRRKRIMFERADAFVALPGGIGTLEELVEILTWAQLGRHKKPILIANLKKFWDPLLVLFQHMEGNNFIPACSPISFLLAETVEEILPKVFGYRAQGNGYDAAGFAEHFLESAPADLVAGDQR